MHMYGVLLFPSSTGHAAWSASPFGRGVQAWRVGHEREIHFGRVRCRSNAVEQRIFR